MKTCDEMSVSVAVDPVKRVAVIEHLLHSRPANAILSQSTFPTGWLNPDIGMNKLAESIILGEMEGGDLDTHVRDVALPALAMWRKALIGRDRIDLDSLTAMGASIEEETGLEVQIQAPPPSPYIPVLDRILDSDHPVADIMATRG